MKIERAVILRVKSIKKLGRGKTCHKKITGKKSLSHVLNKGVGGSDQQLEKLVQKMAQSRQKRTFSGQVFKLLCVSRQIGGSST
jgi:hypothetical protein